MEQLSATIGKLECKTPRQERRREILQAVDKSLESDSQHCRQIAIRPSNWGPYFLRNSVKAKRGIEKSTVGMPERVYLRSCYLPLCKPQSLYAIFERS